MKLDLFVAHSHELQGMPGSIEVIHEFSVSVIQLIKEMTKKASMSFFD